MTHEEEAKQLRMLLSRSQEQVTLLTETARQLTEQRNRLFKHVAQALEAGFIFTEEN